MKREERKVRLSGRIAFIIYLLLLVYFLFFAEWFGRGAGSIVEQSRSYNLVPFAEIGRFIKYRQQLGTLSVMLNIGGNIIGFIPIGLILPVVSRKFYPFIQTLLFGLALSLFVELVQFIFMVGAFDIDDIILNTAGTVIGYILFMIIRLIRRKVLFG